MNCLLRIPLALCLIVFSALWALVWLILISLLIGLLYAVLGRILFAFSVLLAAGAIAAFIYLPGLQGSHCNSESSE